MSAEESRAPVGFVILHLIGLGLRSIFTACLGEAGRTPVFTPGDHGAGVFKAQYIGDDRCTFHCFRRGIHAFF